jgi:2-dehydropantoate 2-reductase
VCLNRTAPGEILHIGEGRVRVGEFDSGSGGNPIERTRWIADAFEQSGVVCSVIEDLANERWRKLVWNIPFNGLSIAAGGIDTARIMADEGLCLLVRQLMSETLGIARALGHRIPASFADTMVDVTRSMGAYRPSSMIDFLEGRAVEIESIWGEPLRAARGAGFEAGRLEMLYHLLRHLVASDDRAG